MVILDEPHHCGEKASWGESVRSAFELAKRILLLSGTPFRSDGQMIPFISYDGRGFCKADDTYDYPTALTDEAVRYLVFTGEKGKATVLTDEGQEELLLNLSIESEEAADRALRHILRPGHPWVKEQLSLANSKLIEVQKQNPDAAGLVICTDQQDASSVAGRLKELTGKCPSVIVSDEDIATDTVEAFCNSKTDWLVAVRQVSEGVDIKRLQVLCYLTTYKTELFFRQVIGRVSRPRYRKGELDPPNEAAGEGDREAYVFLPEHPLLMDHAKNIENAQTTALRNQAEEELRKIRDLEREPSIEITLTTQSLGIGSVIIGTRSYSAADFQDITELAELLQISREKAARAHDRGFRKNQPNNTKNRESAPNIIISKEERMDALRRAIHRKVNFYAKQIKCEPRQVHALYQPFKPQEQMTEEELKQKFKWILQKIAAQPL
jgi:superfamily II DNA or RNA helicase